MSYVEEWEILAEEDGDKTDDGRYYYFGIYIKCICVIYAMGFFDEYVQYQLFVLLVFHRNEQTCVLHWMKCKVCSILAKQVADQVADLSHHTLSVATLGGQGWT